MPRRSRSRSTSRSRSRSRSQERRHGNRSRSRERDDRRVGYRSSREQHSSDRAEDTGRGRPYTDDRRRDRERNIEQGRYKDEHQTQVRGGDGFQDRARYQDMDRRDSRRRNDDREKDAQPAARHHSRSPTERRGRGQHSYDDSRRDMPPPPRRDMRQEQPAGPPARGGRDDRDSRDHKRGRGSREEDMDKGTGVWGKPEEEQDTQAAKAAAVVVQPVMELSGKLAEETNKVNGVVLKHQPPPEAAKPDKKWRLYVFKGNALAEQEPLYLHRFDHCLFGRDPKVADVLCAHPSISKQHAVIQFRRTAKPDEYGLDQFAIRPYLMDLGTVNGSFLNGERIEPERFYELLPKDVIKFGQSSRDYVLLHEELVKE